MPSQAEFMHQVSTIENLEVYERQAEHRRQRQASYAQMFANIEQSLANNQRPPTITFPESNDIFDLSPSGNYIRLFDTSIYIPESSREQIPDALETRLVLDNHALSTYEHDGSNTWTTRSLCGTFAIVNAMNRWREIGYKCLGCGQRRTLNGSPTEG